MLDSEAVVASIGADADGVVLTTAAAARGVGTAALKHLRARGLLVHVCRGIDRLRDHPVTWRTRCRIALAVAGPGAVVGLRSAARLYGLYAYRDADVVEVIVPRGRDQRSSVERLVQTRWLPSSHVTVVDGLPVTSLARTFFDLCGDPDLGLPVAHPAHERHMIRVYNDALARRGLSFTQEAGVLLVMARRGRSGTQLVRKILKRFGPKYTPTHSDTETLFYELLHTYGIDEPEKQVAISGPHGYIGTVDYVWRTARHIVEVDSTWHDGPLDVEQDEERDRRFRVAGYTVGRYRYGQLVERPAAIARELGVALGAGATSATPNSRVRGS